MPDRTLLTAQWVVGHQAGRHCLFEHGEVVLEGGRIVFVGHGFAGEVATRHDYGLALLGPGLIDLDALADLDTTVLGLDNQPAAEKGRIWPRSYVERGPYDMYSPDELAFQKRYAFAQLLRHGVTTALPIASLFYREWGETEAEFAAAAEAAAGLGLRVYLGPAYRSGGLVVEADGRIAPVFDEARGLDGLAQAVRFSREWEGRHGGLVRTMLAPDRIETCTPELLRRTADAARDLAIPVRLHCCQSRLEYELVLALRGMSPPEWLQSLGVLSPRALLPHATWVSGSRGIDRPGRDLEIMRDAGATVVHCPIVSARGGRALDSFSRYRALGLRVGLGTDTWPADLVANMQAGLMLCRVSEGSPGAVSAADLYDAATVAGADALGRPDLGRLAPGAAADIAVFDLADGYMVPGLDPVQALLAGAAPPYARAVWVAGRLVAERGALPGFDMDAAHAQAQSQFARLVSRYPERTWRHPPLEDMFASSYPAIPAARRETR